MYFHQGHISFYRNLTICSFSIQKGEHQPAIEKQSILVVEPQLYCVTSFNLDLVINILSVLVTGTESLDMQSQL